METPIDPSECAMRLAYGEATSEDMAVLCARNADASPERNALEFLAAAHGQLKHALSSPNNSPVSLQLKADMFDYLCWLEDFCQFRQAALDGKAGDHLVLASDGTACFSKTYAEAVRVAMEHDKGLFDATASPNKADNTICAK